MERKQKTNLLIELADPDELLGLLREFYNNNKDSFGEIDEAILSTFDDSPNDEDSVLPRYCGEDGVSCLTCVVDREQVHRVSKSYTIDDWSLSRVVARQINERQDEMDAVWRVTIGPPRVSIVVAQPKGQFAPFLLDEKQETLTPLEFSPPLDVASRRDVRCVAPVDLLGDGGRQLLLAADTMGGSGLGQVSFFIYRLKGRILECIFAGEIDSNMMIGDTDFVDLSLTSYDWKPAKRSGMPVNITAKNYRTLGDLEHKRTLRYEWKGAHFESIEPAEDRAKRVDDEAKIDAEISRIQSSQRELEVDD